MTTREMGVVKIVWQLFLLTSALGCSPVSLRYDAGNHIFEYTHLAFSEQGRVLVSGDSCGNVAAWDVAAERLAWLIRPCDSQIRALKLSQLGSLVIVADSKGTLQAIQVSDGTVAWRVEHGLQSLIAVSATQDDGPERVLCALTGGELQYRCLQDGQVETVVRCDVDWVSPLRISAHVARIAAVDRSNTLYLIDSNTGATTRLWGAPGLSVCALDFSPDGKWLISECSDGAVLLWDVEREQLLRMLLDASNKRAFQIVRFSPDSRMLAMSDGSDVVVQTVQTAHEVTRVTGRAARLIVDADFSPGCSQLATVTLGQGMRDNIWLTDLHKIGSTRLLGSHPERVLVCLFSPDGKILATASGLIKHPQRVRINLWRI